MSRNLCVEIALHNSESWFVWGRFEGKVRNVIHYFFFSITIAYHITPSLPYTIYLRLYLYGRGNWNPKLATKQVFFEFLLCWWIWKVYQHTEKKREEMTPNQYKTNNYRQRTQTRNIQPRARKKNLVYDQGGKKVTPVSTILLLFCCRCCHKCKWQDIFGFGYTYKRRK